jgi:cytoskeletal protein CcmA (bactofilin family)
MAETDFSTVLGPDVVFKGELSFEKAVRLQGKLEGSVRTPGKLHIDREAKVQADVRAGAVTIEGQVRGNLAATDRIEMKATADYEGDLQATKLIVEEGAIFKGHVAVGPGVVKGEGPAKAASEAPPAGLRGAPAHQGDQPPRRPAAAPAQHSQAAAAAASA